MGHTWQTWGSGEPPPMGRGEFREPGAAGGDLVCPAGSVFGPDPEGPQSPRFQGPQDDGSGVCLPPLALQGEPRQCACSCSAGLSTETGPRLSHRHSTEGPASAPSLSGVAM